MRIACWITTAKNRHSQYAILTVFHCNSSCTNAPGCYVYKYIAVPVNICFNITLPLTPTSSKYSQIANYDKTKAFNTPDHCQSVDTRAEYELEMNLQPVPHKKNGV